MFKKLGFVVVFSLMLVSRGTLAVTTSNALIATLGLDDGSPDTLFIALDRAKDASNPSCHTNPSWAYVRSLSSEQGKKVYAMLLAAKASQTPVTLVGTGNCQNFGGVGIEVLQAVYY